MAQKSEAESQEWVVTGMDCASCAVKIRTAVERFPGVSDVNVAVMAEKLTLKLEPGTTPRDKIEAAVTKLGFGIGATKAKKAKAFVMPGALDAGKDDGHAGPDHADHVGHDHVASSDTMANVTPAPVDSEDGHGAPPTTLRFKLLSCVPDCCAALSKPCQMVGTPSAVVT